VILPFRIKTGDTAPPLPHAQRRGVTTERASRAGSGAEHDEAEVLVVSRRSRGGEGVHDLRVVEGGIDRIADGGLAVDKRGGRRGDLRGCDAVVDRTVELDAVLANADALGRDDADLVDDGGVGRAGGIELAEEPGGRRSRSAVLACGLVDGRRPLCPASGQRSPVDSQRSFPAR
jgi:hypothetical protein